MTRTRRHLTNLATFLASYVHVAVGAYVIAAYLDYCVGG